MNELDDVLVGEIKTRREKLKKLQDSGKDPFLNKKFKIDCKTINIVEQFEELEGKIVSLAGRIITKRIMGNHALQWHHKSEA